jgi:peptidoglycan lytic transglycosylase
MLVRFGAATCVATILLGHSSPPLQEQRRNRLSPVAIGDTIVGAAATYNPYRGGFRSGGPETASGEPYDPAAWTAAIQTDLREQFGGVRHGYRPTYALVASADKQAIIKINDVGPLKPGRVIDLNEQAMRYFSRGQDFGLIEAVKITPLLGDDWSPGPIADNG